MPDGSLLAIFDGGPESWWGYHFPNQMGYTTSRDGVLWSPARYLAFAPKVNKWWDIMRGEREVAKLTHIVLFNPQLFFHI